MRTLKCVWLVFPIAALAALALVACSGNSPTTPSSAETRSSSAAAISLEGLSVRALAGSYALMFLDHGQLLSNPYILPAGDELVLWAQVRNSFGTLAAGGSVTFQVCKRNGAARFPYGPSIECETGSAIWSHVATWEVTAGTCLPFAPESGNACIDFGSIATPNSTIGFRYKYVGQGSGIASGESLALDVTWQ